MDLTPGQQIGTYRIVRLLGKGGMGAVYEVEHVQGEQIDLSWAKAKHEAAVEHVLSKVAMKAQSRDIYRAHVLENRSVEDVSSEFGVAADIIYKVKNRVNRMIEAVEEEYSEEI